MTPGLFNKVWGHHAIWIWSLGAFEICRNWRLQITRWPQFFLDKSRGHAAPVGQCAPSSVTFIFYFSLYMYIECLDRCTSGNDISSMNQESSDDGGLSPPVRSAWNQIWLLIRKFVEWALGTVWIISNIPSFDLNSEYYAGKDYSISDFWGLGLILALDLHITAIVYAIYQWWFT